MGLRRLSILLVADGDGGDVRRLFERIAINDTLTHARTAAEACDLLRSGRVQGGRRLVVVDGPSPADAVRVLSAESTLARVPIVVIAPDLASLQATRGAKVASAAIAPADPEARRDLVTTIYRYWTAMELV